MARITLVEKLVARLQVLGLSERKAKEVAKGLAPTVRSAVKTELAEKAKPKEAKSILSKIKDGVERAVAINGYRLRLDLPTVPKEGAPELDLLRVMHGLTTSHTYLVAAVRGKEGIVAIRQLTPNEYNVKFYPTFEYWGKTQEDLAGLGGISYLKRDWYERMHFSPKSLEGLLVQLVAEAKVKSRIKKALGRMLALTTKPLFKAFGVLYTSRRYTQNIAA